MESVKERRLDVELEGYDESHALTATMDGTPLASKSSVEDILARRGFIDDEEDDEENDEEDDEEGNEGGEGEIGMVKNIDGQEVGTALEPSEEEDVDFEVSANVIEDSQVATDPKLLFNTSIHSDSSSTALVPVSGTTSLMSQPNIEVEVGSGLEAPSTMGKFSGQEVITGGSGVESPKSMEDSASVLSSPPLAPINLDLAKKAAEKALAAAEAHAQAEAAESALLVQRSLTEQAIREAKENAKEVRKLRRHVVKLNAELEAAETEMHAQRTELERAAARIEKDRTRNKEEKERAAREHKKEREAAAAEHRASMEKAAAVQAEQIVEMEERVRRANEAREREGGDWDKELKDTTEREREAMKKAMLLEDEKSTLSGHVSLLETQMTALQSRLHSVAETAETATEREREAEDRLDAALSLHARQIGQRQGREAQLERTIAELGAVLVAARNRGQGHTVSSAGAVASAPNVKNAEDGTSLRSRLQATEEELETLRAQLTLEHQHCEALRQELHDMSKERTEEMSVTHARQKQHDRRVADLAATISRLQISLRDLKNVEPSSAYGAGTSLEEEGVGTNFEIQKELQQQVSSLTRQVFQQQSKVEENAVELSTLRSRLSVALTRADNAENALTMSGNLGSSSPGKHVDLESGFRGYDGGKKVRRRGGRTKGLTAASKSKSIRSALHLDLGRAGVSETRQQIGTAIDALDQWSVETGSYIRHHPLARAGFLVYLTVLHLWTFCVLVFHAHTYDPVHEDMGHGPQALLENRLSYRNLEQLHKNP